MIDVRFKTQVSRGKVEIMKNEKIPHKGFFFT